VRAAVSNGTRWGLELIEYAGREIGGKARVRTEKNRVTCAWDSTLEDWFVNGAKGLEHGLTIRQRPVRLELRLAVRGGLRPEGGGSAVRFVDGSGSAVVSYSGLKAWDADGRLLPARMEGCDGVLHLRVDDREARYPVNRPRGPAGLPKASGRGEFFRDFGGGFRRHCGRRGCHFQDYLA